jgi:hypothetical protein
MYLFFGYVNLGDWGWGVLRSLIDLVSGHVN